METTIIFSHSETGHVLEYFHHIHSICVGQTGKKFVFVVPEGFEVLKKEQLWPDAPNVVFDYLSCSEVNSYKGKPVFKLSAALSKILNGRIHKYKAVNVLSLFWFPIVPFGVIRFPHKVEVSTILYDVYLRELDELSIQAKMRHKLNFWLMSKSKKVNKVFVLNDDKTKDVLNELFRTDNFQFLPDPYNPVCIENNIDLRKDYGIDNNVTVFAHFGGLTRRKGTLRILEAVEQLSDVEKEKCCLIFAGRVYIDIKDEFYKKLEEIADKVRVIVKDEFCSYAYLASLCQCCNAILMPYDNPNRSSGLLGYSSQFCKPVIAPSSGLIGDIVRRYSLGITGDVCDKRKLAAMMRQVIRGVVDAPTMEYCYENSIDKFCNAIKTSI